MFNYILWVVQIIVDAAVIYAVFRLVADRLRRPAESVKQDSPVDGLTAGDIHELTDSVTCALDEMKRLADKVSGADARESEKALKWGKRLDRLEQIVRADLRRLETRIEKMESGARNTAVRVPVDVRQVTDTEAQANSEERESEMTPEKAVAVSGRSGDRPIHSPRTVRDEIRDLHEQGMPLEEIARKLQMGRDEVRLMVGLREGGAS